MGPQKQFVKKPPVFAPKPVYYDPATLLKQIQATTDQYKPVPVISPQDAMTQAQGMVPPVDTTGLQTMLQGEQGVVANPPTLLFDKPTTPTYDTLPQFTGQLTLNPAPTRDRGAEGRETAKRGLLSGLLGLLLGGTGGALAAASGAIGGTAEQMDKRYEEAVAKNQTENQNNQVLYNAALAKNQAEVGRVNAENARKQGQYNTDTINYTNAVNRQDKQVNDAKSNVVDLTKTIAGLTRQQAQDVLATAQALLNQGATQQQAMESALNIALRPLQLRGQIQAGANNDFLQNREINIRAAGAADDRRFRDRKEQNDQTEAAAERVSREKMHQKSVDATVRGQDLGLLSEQAKMSYNKRVNAQKQVDALAKDRSKLEDEVASIGSVLQSGKVAEDGIERNLTDAEIQQYQAMVRQKTKKARQLTGQIQQIKRGAGYFTQSPLSPKGARTIKRDNGGNLTVRVVN